MTFTAIENDFWSEDYKVMDKPFEQWNHLEIINFMLNSRIDDDKDVEMYDELTDYLISNRFFALSEPVRYSSRMLDYGNEDSYMANLKINPEIDIYSRKWDRAVALLQIPCCFKLLRSLLPKNTPNSQVYIDSWDREYSLIKYRIYCSIGD